MQTDVGPSGTTQFEGRTAEEAVARAKAALGDSGALRCWKTRRGGVGGFFAKEIFVAGLTPPPGSETTRGRASRAQAGPKRGALDQAPAADGAPEDVATSAAVGPVPRRVEDTSVWPEDHLAGLVEATSDQVSLGPLAIPAEAFDEVLAEAQAALTREREGNGTAAPRAPAGPGPQTVASEEPGDSEHQPVPPEGSQAAGPPNRGENDMAAMSPESSRAREQPAAARLAKKAIRPKAKTRRTPPSPRSSAVTAHGQSGRSARMPDLRPGLRSLGVPAPYVPRGQRPSLDQLASVMGTLPVPPALPTCTGAVVVVVGSGGNLQRTVDVVAAVLSLGQRDVLRFWGSPGAAQVQPADVMTADGPRLGRQISRRQTAGRTSVMAVQAEPGMPLGREVSGLLEQVAPDYVLAAVDAASKRADVEYWIGELLRVDALALWDLSFTRTPAELLGVLPIAFVDGEPSTPLRWTLALAGRAMDRGGR